MHKEESLENYDVLQEAGIVASHSWNFHFKNPRLVRNLFLLPSIEGSDSVRFIPAQSPDKHLSSVIVEKNGIRRTFNDKLRGIFINDHSFTIALAGKDNNGDFAKFSSSTKAYLTFLRTEEQSTIDKLQDK